MALHQLSLCLSKYYGKKVLILLDEYDTPMQEAYVNGYWEKRVSFIRSLFNSTFKTNPYLERAIMTGITRVSREPIFSDLNNLEVVTATSDKYADNFGFTEEEVFKVLDEYGMSDKKQEVKRWYDGFTFGKRTDIYNPWSILNYLDTRENAVWSLLLACGYLKAIEVEFMEEAGRWEYTLKLTNREIQIMFAHMIRGWFAVQGSGYNDFIKALLADDLKAMNYYMNKVALKQIEDRKYETALVSKGIPKEKIRKYGFAFCGKKVLIGKG